MVDSNEDDLKELMLRTMVLANELLNLFGNEVSKVMENNESSPEGVKQLFVELMASTVAAAAVSRTIGTVLNKKYGHDAVLFVQEATDEVHRELMRAYENSAEELNRTKH